MSAVRTLPPVAVEVMESLAQHRLLATRQVRALHMPHASASWSRSVLGSLARAGFIDCARGGAGSKLWFLTPAGHDALRTIIGDGRGRRARLTHATAAGPLRAHTLALNDVGVAFVRAARACGDDCGPLAWRHEVAHPIAAARGRSGAELVIADALLTYAELRPGGALHEHRLFIELDRGTTLVGALVEKLTRYARLHDAWRERCEPFPRVLVVFAGREERLLRLRMRGLMARARSDPRLAELELLLALHGELVGRGPFAGVCIDPRRPDRYVDWQGRHA